jgi:hypothetical protein
MSSADTAHLAEGYAAHRDGLPRSGNPYEKPTASWMGWNAGWDQSAQDTVGPAVTEDPSLPPIVAPDHPLGGR